MSSEQDQLELTHPIYVEASALAHFLDRVTPLYCRPCGARDHHDCTCTRLEIPLPECEQ